MLRTYDLLTMSVFLGWDIFTLNRVHTDNLALLTLNSHEYVKYLKTFLFFTYNIQNELFQFLVWYVLTW